MPVDRETDTPGVSTVCCGKETTVSLNAEPGSDAVSVSAINPFEVSDVVAEIWTDKADDDSQIQRSTCTFSLLCDRDTTAEQVVDAGVLRLRVETTTAGDADSGSTPTVTIRAERGAVVENLTDAQLSLRVHVPATEYRSSVISLGAGESRQTSIASTDKVVVLQVGVHPNASLTRSELEKTTALLWSSPVRLLADGDAKPCVVSFSQPSNDSGSSLASFFLVSLTTEHGVVRVSIRPQVVVLNSTVCCSRFVLTHSSVRSRAFKSHVCCSYTSTEQGMALRLLPTSNDGDGLMSTRDSVVRSGCGR